MNWQQQKHICIIKNKKQKIMISMVPQNEKCHQRSKDYFPGGASGKQSACQCRRLKRSGFSPWVGKIPWRKKWQPTLVFCLQKFMGRGALWATVHGSQELETT